MDYRSTRRATFCRYQGRRYEWSSLLITENQDGFPTHTGHVASRGPSTMVVLLTEPFGLTGRSVQFPIEEVVEEKVISA